MQSRVVELDLSRAYNPHNEASDDDTVGHINPLVVVQRRQEQFETTVMQMSWSIADFG